jgi:hypothetical protein
MTIAGQYLLELYLNERYRVEDDEGNNVWA